MKAVREFLSTPIVGEYDVIVVGGGVAGAAAALSAARLHMNTLLIEKMTVLGGLATAGQVNVFLPLCDGLGHKVIGGIPEELLLLSVSAGNHDVPKAWKGAPMEAKGDKRYESDFDAGWFSLALEALLRNNGVHLMLDTCFCAPVMGLHHLRGVIVENKSGRQCYLCKTAVDATGDGDVFARAGASYMEGTNYLAYWATRMDEKKQAKAWTLGTSTGKGLPRDYGKYLATNVTEVNRFLQDAHQLALDTAVKEKTEILSFPTMAQFRTSRRLTGEYCLSEADVFRRFDDAVALTGDWRKAGSVYAVPFRALRTEKVDNLLAAGRNISVTPEMWEITRVIPCAAATGQAAGIAAALSVQRDEKFSKLPNDLLQKMLRLAGVILDFPK